MPTSVRAADGWNWVPITYSSANTTITCGSNVITSNATITVQPVQYAMYRPVETPGRGQVIHSPLTAEQLAEREQLMERQREEYAERMRQAEEEQAAAAARAHDLLLSCLTPEQQAEYAEHKRFHFHGSSGHRYCIHRGMAHNVFRVNDDGERLIEFCGHASGHVPVEDNVLAQKLLIEADEERYLAVANAYPLHDGEGGYWRDYAHADD